MIEAFPPVTSARPDGLLAVGGDLEVGSLLLAYRSGIFPWPVPGLPLAWFAPPRRAVLFADRFRLGRSHRRGVARAGFAFGPAADFAAIVAGCSVRGGRGGGTWITSAMAAAYGDLARAGFAEAYECRKEGRLAGGLYGVRIGRYFAGESMFHAEPYASVFVLEQVVSLLAAAGVRWIDCQVMSPHLARMGAVEIPRQDFMTLLRDALAGP